MKARITDRAIKGLTKPERGAQIVYDREVPGFGVRLTAGGSVSFILNYVIHGRERRYTFGGWPELSSEAARRKALDLRSAVDNGIDPLEARQEKLTAPTVADLCALYLERHAIPKKRKSSAERDADLVRRLIVPELGKRRTSEVTSWHVETLHTRMKATPYQANRLLALLQKMFELAIKWKLATENPAKGIERYQEDPRERYLSVDEIRRLIAALDAYPKFTTKAGQQKTHAGKEKSANIIRLLLLTGARRGEVTGAQWDQFDLAAGTWTKPSAHTKQKKTHRVPLSAPAMQMLVAIHERRGESPFVFPSENGHQGELKRAWASICKAAEIKDVRLHDLRHTFASIIANAPGMTLQVIGGLLGHTQTATTKRYTHLFDDPMRKAADHVGVMIGADKADVVMIGREGK